MTSRILVVAAVAISATFARPARAQSRAQSAWPDSLLCFGFSFNAWKPELDWRAAGQPAFDTTRLGKAPSGRDWAANDSLTGDRTMLLFPMWWPAGVVVSLDHKPLSPGDTSGGRAVAMVADGRKTPPATTVRVWRRAC